MDRAEFDALLEMACGAQRAYYDALAALESALGREIDGTQDLEDMTIERLLAEHMEGGASENSDSSGMTTADLVGPPHIVKPLKLLKL